MANGAEMEGLQLMRRKPIIESVPEDLAEPTSKLDLWGRCECESRGPGVCYKGVVIIFVWYKQVMNPKVNWKWENAQKSNSY